MPPQSPFSRIVLPAAISFVLLGPSDETGLLAEERALLSPQALPERVAEFARGRVAARRALAALGIPGAERIAILRHGLRAPLWPEGIVGTISHSGEWAAAACARRADYRGVGVDLERVRPLRNGLARRVARPDELPVWETLPIALQPLVFSLMFSAKESIYKALFPATGVFLSYQDASIEWPCLPGPPHRADGWKAGFTWTLHRESGAEFPLGYRGVGRAWAGAGFVLTAVWT